VVTRLPSGMNRAKIVARVAVEAFTPVGILQKGRSRSWIDDRGWWFLESNFNRPPGTAAAISTWEACGRGTTRINFHLTSASAIRGIRSRTSSISAMNGNLRLRSRKWLCQPEQKPSSYAPDLLRYATPLTIGRSSFATMLRGTLKLCTNQTIFGGPLGHRFLELANCSRLPGRTDPEMNVD
jgi:hypothetical protein